MAPLFLRRRDTAAALAISESVVLAYERAGLLPVTRLPGLRAVRHERAAVEALAAKIVRGEVTAWESIQLNLSASGTFWPTRVPLWHWPQTKKWLQSAATRRLANATLRRSVGLRKPSRILTML